MGLSHLPVCMAKTPYSFTDRADVLGAPTDFTISVNEIRLSAGAGFLVALTGSIMTMPGLPKKPAAESIRLDEDGSVLGLS
jgi:formate--tetrahydrofolate ligase